MASFRKGDFLDGAEEENTCSYPDGSHDVGDNCVLERRVRHKFEDQQPHAEHDEI